MGKQDIASIKDLLINSVTIFIAVLLFTNGFLLMKLEIGRKSSQCSSPLQTDGDGKCWSLLPGSFKYEKLVILVIDALRYDFAFHQDNGASKFAFHNQMPIFHELMKREGCKKARLWRFKADAPTTTMQRLKGLTTGSLPTFMDLSRNFASSEITEDNVLDQFLASGKNITYMGDDTWMGLFPGRFNKAFPYPSFDVKDLHLVDNGVMEHLLPEIRTTDWQLLIAHFLGVDHCGHRYGPFHPEMSLKLQQMNEVVKSVIHSVDNRTLVLIMGDHGMTHTGDHGGDTFNEVTSALFAYSSAGAFKDCKDGERKDTIVNQVDIVPTISLLLGTSIPFANLGVVIGDMLRPYEDLNASGSIFMNALLINAKQIHTYISAYQEITNSLPRDSYTSLLRDYKELEKVEKHYSSPLQEEKFVKYLKSAKEMCQLVWAKFNIALMLSGLSFLVLWIVQNTNSPTLVSKVSFVLFGAISFCAISSVTVAPNLASFFALLICLVSFLLIFIIALKNSSKSSLFENVFLVLLVAYSVSFTSNSFVLNEDLTALYLCVSVFLCLSFRIQSFAKNLAITNKDGKTDGAQTADNQKSENGLLEIIRRKTNETVVREKKMNQMQEGQRLSKIPLKLFLYSFAGILCTRLAFAFRCCRAEQFWCFQDSSSDELAGKLDYGIIRILVSSISLVLCVWLTLRILKKEVQLKSLFMTGCLLLSPFLCAIGWILQLISREIWSTVDMPDWYSAVLPRCVYAVLIVFFVFHWIDPISSTLPIITSSDFHEATSLKGKLGGGRRPMKGNTQGPVEDAALISTVFVGSIVMMISGLITLFCLLLGPRLATAIPLCVFSCACALEMISTFVRQKNSKFVPFGHVVVWNMIFSYWWFATGHQASISSIRWDAAFVGFQGNHVTNVIPATLLLLDTFSMQILAGISLPLLVFWPQVKWSWTTARYMCEEATCPVPIPWWDQEYGEILSDLFVKHYRYHVVKMIGTMLAACIHRQHLMVWSIFAPRYLFEGLSLIIVLFATLFSYACIHNIKRKLKMA